VPGRAAQVSRGAVGSPLVYEPVVAVLVDERHIAVKAGDRTSGVGGATRGGPQVRQQNSESERRHRADRDPKEEQRAGRPWGLIAEHGKSVSGCVAREVLTTPTIDKTINSTMTSIRGLSASRPPVNALSQMVSTVLTNGVNMRCGC
jgi:hypothetical protein